MVSDLSGKKKKKKMAPMKTRNRWEQLKKKEMATVKKEKRKKWFLEKKEKKEKKEKEELGKNCLEASSKAKRDNKKIMNLPIYP